MPWQETNAAMERTKFLAAVEAKAESFVATCRRFGIPRQAGYDLLKRVERLGVDGLRTRPTRANSQPNATTDEIADLIVDLRKGRPSWGPKKIKAWLELDHPERDFPATSTIGEVLKRRGMITPSKGRLRLPPVGTPSSEYAGVNAIWCIDHKGGFALADHSRCHPLTRIDGCSSCRSRPPTNWALCPLRALSSPLGPGTAAEAPPRWRP